jgi:hypothetical protein
MDIDTYLATFAGLPVVAFDAEAELPDDPAAVAWRLAVEDFEADPPVFEELVEAWLARVPAESVRALIVGEWGSAYESSPPIDLLCRLGARLTGLRALFLGELVPEECEISWINQDDITPLFAAYPALTVLWIRGAEGLTLAPVRHDTLRELVFQSGGLSDRVVRAIGECEFPALEHLELWLGVAQYGGNATAEDLAGILSGGRLPALRHLALANAETADQIAAAVADAPIVGRLTTLDLSKGILTEQGVHALLAGQPLTHLRRLDLHHHYVPPALAARVRAELPGVDVDVSGEQKPHEYGDDIFRYTAVSE